MDEDNARAARMDEWVVWEAAEGRALEERVELFFLFSSFSSFM